MQGMMQDVTTELLLKLQTLIDKQSVTDRFSFQSGTSYKLLLDIVDINENTSDISCVSI